MKKYLNSNGSTWRKWDLHVHSPASRLHNEFTNWDDYLQALENLTDISVLGITDYYSIEGYQKVAEYKKAGGLQKIDLILPNIELRIDTVTSRERPINIHIIFSPDVVQHINDKFFRELKYRYGDRTFSCSERDLIDLGRITKGEQLSDHQAYKEGMNQFKVSIDGLKGVLQQNSSLFNGKYLTIVANKSTDGASGIRESSMQMEQRKIYQFAHCIFSSRPNDREFFLGKAEGHTKTSIMEKFGSLKPCVHGSDAHKIDKICKPDQNRFTWIKADPSFEGLLQILHEPEMRVAIQENNPDIKNSYDVIESVKFIDDESFGTNEIKLNPGLNTIIGGKSSGKSLLLYKIAQAVSIDELHSRENDDHWKNPYKSSFIENIDFEVKWRNGDISNTARNIGKITYIPQMYINSLSEETANKDLQKKIKEILFQNEENALFLNQSREKINRYTNDTKYDIVRLFEKIGDLHKVKEQLKSKGNKEAIQNEKEQIQAKIALKVSSSNLSPVDELAMKQLEKEKNDTVNALIEREEINRVSNEVSKGLNNVLDYVNSNLKSLSSKLHADNQEILDDLRTQVNKAFQEAQEKFDKEDLTFKEWKTTNQHKENEIKIELKPYLEKLKGLTDISALRKSLEEQEQLLKEIEIQESQIKVINDEISMVKNGIYNTFEYYFDTLVEVKEFFNGKQEFSNLLLKTNISFDETKFEDNFLSSFNRSRRLNNLFPSSNQLELFDADGMFLFNENTYLDKIKFLCDYLIDTDEKNLRLRKSFTKQQAVEQLLNTSFTKIIYDLEKDGDRLTEMSPGKRGLILMELFLEMSNEKHPILIDQPEDNLDNRTISKDLVEILKSKKDIRQIIIVTHNANLVVLTDSENVIVANQDIQLQENQSYRFEYLTGSIECDYQEATNQKLHGKGIKSHVCEILEGGKEAFETREKKYGF